MSLVELRSDEPCPCGSDGTYGDCCSRKGFSFRRGADDELFRTIPLHSESVEALESAREMFADLYGRAPVEEDLLFGHIADPTDSVYSSARELMRAGLDTPLVFAYTRTDGLLVTEMNLDLVSDRDVELFSHYVREYEEMLSDDFDSGAIGSVAFVTLGNSFLRDVTTKASGKVLAVLADFLSRHVPASLSDPRMFPSRGVLTKFRVRTPIDYGLFSALKAKKTFEGIAQLTYSGIPEGIFALARSLFENTLFLDAIVGDEELFWKSIAPKADAETYAFGTHPDGRVNFNHVVHRTTGERLSVVVRISDLALAADRPSHVTELYSLFYVVACQYAHMDVLSAPLYFDDPDPFDQLDSTLVASLVALVLGGDMIRALADVPGVVEGFRRDAAQFLLRLRQDLGPAVELVGSDPEHPSEIMGVLSRVMDAWGAASTRGDAGRNAPV